MIQMTVKTFAKSIMHGSKFTYRTVPRLLTIWLDLGEDPLTAPHHLFKQMTEDIARAIRGAPVYKVRYPFPFAGNFHTYLILQVVYRVSTNCFSSGPQQHGNFWPFIEVDRHHYAKLSPTIPLAFYLGHKIHQVQSTETR